MPRHKPVGVALKVMTYRLLMALVCFGIGCGEKAADVVKEYRPKVEAQLARIKATVKAADAQLNPAPPTLTDKLSFSGNALLVLREAVKDPPDKPQHDLIAKYDLMESVHDALAEPGKRDTTLLRSQLAQFLGVRYLVVISTWAYSPAMAKGQGTFEGGAWSGAITILDLDKGVSAGTLTADSGSSDSVTSTQANLSSNLQSDIYGQAKHAINRALEPYMAPGQKAF